MKEKDIKELLRESVIDNSVAERISAYYVKKRADAPNKILIFFGALGALLIGLGIILIIGHNWDEISKSTKTILCFGPLIIGQLSCLFTLIKKEESKAWRESSSIFLVMGIGACMSLISQVYNLDGNVSAFLLTWGLLSLPVIYLMKSSGVGLIYLLMISFYAFGSFNKDPQHTEYIYWALLTGFMPFYILKIKNDPEANVLGFYNWFIVISTGSVLFLLNIQNEEKQFLCYLLLSVTYLSIGLSNYFKSVGRVKNAFLIAGGFGILFVLFFLSGKDSSEWIFQQTTGFKVEEMTWLENVPSIILGVVGIIITLIIHKKERLRFGFVLVIVFSFLLFLLGRRVNETFILVNLLLFIGGIILIYSSTQENKIGWLNLGMCILAFLIFIRFLDTDFDYVVKGIVFVFLGIGFFVANFLFTRKIKRHED